MKLIQHYYSSSLTVYSYVYFNHFALGMEICVIMLRDHIQARFEVRNAENGTHSRVEVVNRSEELGCNVASVPAKPAM